MALQSVAQLTEPQNGSLDNYDDERVSQVAAKAYARIADIWKLNNTIAADLISVSPRTWARMKSGNWSGKLNRDQLMRVSAITGIYKGLHLYFSDGLADQWTRLRNTGPLFSGHAPIDIMLEGGLASLLDTRNYIDALRGGV